MPLTDVAVRKAKATGFVTPLSQMAGRSQPMKLISIIVQDEAEARRKYREYSRSDENARIVMAHANQTRRQAGF